MRECVGYIVSRVTTTQSHKRKGTGRMKKVRVLGLDVHAETIAVAIAEPGEGEVRSLGIIPNREESVRKLIKKLGPPEQLKACAEKRCACAGLEVREAEIKPCMVTPGGRVRLYEGRFLAARVADAAA